ncbi:hypothetical protein [Streptomyces sp. SS162]|uniref:hypothetical protein n=1 Tax=Streptomyces sp. SS162 TaxID=3108484 RepID=UPI002F42F333
MASVTSSTTWCSAGSPSARVGCADRCCEAGLVAAAKEALARLEGLLALPGGAPRLLADRLTDRLVKTGGETLVVSPYGWLVGRGLMQRQSTGAATTAFGQPRG